MSAPAHGHTSGEVATQAGSATGTASRAGSGRLPSGKKKRGRSLRRALRVVLLLALVGSIGGYVLYKRLEPPPVVTVAVVRGKAIDAVYATGTVEPEDRVQVRAKTSGSIAEVFVKEGTVVKKGDLLARIDNPLVTFDLKRGKVDSRAASAQANEQPQLQALRAQQQSIRADLDLARLELGRARELEANGAAPATDVDRAKLRVAQLEASVAANEAQQRALGIDLSANAARAAAAVEGLATRVTDTEVRAPLDGVVLVKNIEPGEVISVNQVLFKVGDVSRLILEVSVDEADVARVSDGTAHEPASAVAVTLYAFAKRVFAGKVIEILPDANRDRKAFLVKVALDEPPLGLRSGMSAEVNIISEEHDGVLLAPSEAEDGGSVWVLAGERVTRRTVRVGVRDLLRIEVLEGLDEGEAVVVEGQDKLEDGKKVRATVRAPDKLGAGAASAPKPAGASL